MDKNKNKDVDMMHLRMSNWLKLNRVGFTIFIIKTCENANKTPV